MSPTTTPRSAGQHRHRRRASLRRMSHPSVTQVNRLRLLTPAAVAAGRGASGAPGAFVGPLETVGADRQRSCAAERKSAGLPTLRGGARLLRARAAEKKTFFTWSVTRPVSAGCGSSLPPQHGDRPEYETLPARAIQLAGVFDQTDVAGGRHGEWTEGSDRCYAWDGVFGVYRERGV